MTRAAPLDLAAIEGVVLDMDGVVWRGTQALPGAAAFFGRLREEGVPFVLATNNSGTSCAAYAERLQDLGIVGVRPEQVVTSGTVTADVMAAEFAPGTPVHVLGSDALAEALASAGFPSAPAAPASATAFDAEVVVVGIDLELTYDKLERAAALILAGAAFLGTNGDVALPTERGLAPGTGSILAALQAATGKVPRLMGKPEPHMYASAARRLGADPARTLMIGDRLDTDILGASRYGMRTALVLSGVETAASAAASELVADGTYRDLADLLEAWERETTVRKGTARRSPR